MVMPGDNVTITVELIHPVAIEKVCVLLSAKVVVQLVPVRLLKLLN